MSNPAEEDTQPNLKARYAKAESLLDRFLKWWMDSPYSILLLVFGIVGAVGLAKWSGFLKWIFS